MLTVETLGSKATWILRQDAFPLAVVVEVAHDDFDEYLDGVRHEGGATIYQTVPLRMSVESI